MRQVENLERAFDAAGSACDGGRRRRTFGGRTPARRQYFRRQTPARGLPRAFAGTRDSPLSCAGSNARRTSPSAKLFDRSAKWFVQQLRRQKNFHCATVCGSLIWRGKGSVFPLKSRSAFQYLAGRPYRLCRLGRGEVRVVSVASREISDVRRERVGRISEGLGRPRISTLAACV